MIADQLGSGWLTVTLAGQVVPADKVGTVTIRHGRRDIDSPAEPGTCHLVLDRTALTALPSVGAALRVELSSAALTALGADAATASAATVRFVGDVTDCALAPLTDARQSLLELVAVAPAARAGRIRIGDTPWPAETDGARAQHILDATVAKTGITLGTVDPGQATVLARDVDSQPPLDLLYQLGVASGGRLHLARDGAVSWHDAIHRRNALAVTELTADDVLRDTLWRLDLAGLVNDVTVTYGPELLDANGEPTGEQNEVTVTDPVSIASPFGRLSARIVTQLANADDATELASQLVGRRSRPRWRIDALEVELLRTLSPAQTLALLKAQPGDLLAVTGFPESGPQTTARLFAEGWTEIASRYTWSMALDVVAYSLAGASPRWVDVDPATRWQDVPADLTWQQAIGWHTDADLGRWVDQPSSRRWIDVDPALTWATYTTAA